MLSERLSNIFFLNNLCITLRFKNEAACASGDSKGGGVCKRSISGRTWERYSRKLQKHQSLTVLMTVETQFFNSRVESAEKTNGREFNLNSENGKEEYF